MKPNDATHGDSVQSLLDEIWEPLPPELEHRLQNIPDQLRIVQTIWMDRIVLFMNIILLAWAGSITVYFWSPLKRLFNTFFGSSVDFGINSIFILTNPIGIICTLACLGFVVWWLDLEKSAS